VSNTCGEIQTRLVTVTVSVQTCTSPTITSQPTPVSVKSGQNAVLSVVATGTETLLYQWFEGAADIMDKPVGDGVPFFTAERVLKTTSYWVQVSNGCGTANSQAAVVTVEPTRRRAVGHR
jgi:hypothetical protein